VRRAKAAFSSGCKSHPAILLQPEAIGAVMGKWLKPLCGNGVMVWLLTHRQTIGAATDRLNLRPPRHISTLPISDVQPISNDTFSLWLAPEYEGPGSAIYSCRSPDTENPADTGFLKGNYRPIHVIHQIAVNGRFALISGRSAFIYSV